MSSSRYFCTIAVSVVLSALLLGSATVAATSATISVRATDLGYGSFSVLVSWDAGSRNPPPYVCVSDHGNAPLSFGSGTAGSQQVGLTEGGVYTFGLYTDGTCNTLVDNQSVRVNDTDGVA
jgi:hypothetical protein